MSEPNMTFNTIVIGGGQAGLVTGYYLQRLRRDFVIVNAGEQIGDTWRNRWDSLRLFTNARFNGLPGMPFPAPAHSFPTKNQMADYLEAYATKFALPVQTGIRVDRLARNGQRFVITSGDQHFEADNVIVAMASHQRPRVPAFAQMLDSGIVQLHSSAYRNPSQLQEGGVLVVGAGNSGAEIAFEVARSHPTWLSGRPVGHIPFRIESAVAQWVLSPLVFRVLFHHVFSVSTPIGRKLRPQILSHGGPLVRTKPNDLVAVGIERVPRTTTVQNGLPVLENEQVLEVANVIWCTGFAPDFSWIDLPVFGEKDELTEPVHHRGIVTNEPGLYFVGLLFLYAMSSSLVVGVGRDAKHVVDHLAARKN